MKKTLITLLALAGVACGATAGDYEYMDPTIDSGTYTLKTENWTTGDSTLYNYLYGVFVEGGTLTFNLNIHYAGGSCGHYQALLHVGQKDTGFSIYANGTTNLIVSSKNVTSAEQELANTGLVSGANTVAITLTGNNIDQTAAVTFVVNGTAYDNAANASGEKDVKDLKWSDMGWNTNNGEAAKYSINNVAPGWANYSSNEGELNKAAAITTLTSGSVSFTQGLGAVILPEPATATLSLLALAGLAVRRRRK